MSLPDVFRTHKSQCRHFFRVGRGGGGIRVCGLKGYLKVVSKVDGPSRRSTHFRVEPVKRKGGF